MATEKDRDRTAPRDDDAAREEIDRADTPGEGEKLHPNPPFTKTKHMTSPKFGSAGSGGLENEPGPERD